ncbi:MAG: HAMP domain-containing sensor histidine kinase [Rhodoferax sp.]|uniref:HAMP domain-containing sensor histidine kinase n=1 Tax=Rhodoferax sp. TaxID=50421 RepID=UPI002ACE57E6|nr:HAMP domain-containing sensor histidine kinase [Rhodoferax sp.]MDZ7890432.1 HAMP domain-containing sensor histidine kinase [Rhodoferax sp.]
MLHKLYVRIWLAVVLTVVVLTLLVGWVWRMTSEPPLREVVVRNEFGEVIGSGRARLSRPPPVPGLSLDDHTSPPDSKDDDNDDRDSDRPGRFGRGPEFLVRMSDGQTIHLHLPRPPSSSFKAPFGFAWTLALVAVAVALGTYPIIRRLTRRLETLQNGVERWGSGDLSARVSMHGGDEVGFLAARFNHAAEQIETLVQARDTLLASQKSLLANASHELRSPLARIRMGLELMGSTPSAAFKREVARNIAELDQLIEEILLASRLDAKEADLGTVESVDLVGLAAEERARNQALLDVELQALEVPGVAKLLRRAVRNLLENARRYGAGDVRLMVRKETEWALIQVCDSGPGVPPEQQQRIFEPFYRLPGASEREGGVGLGLALVKSIAERHGGTVRCTNRPEGGACFEIRLPLKNA